MKNLLETVISDYQKHNSIKNPNFKLRNWQRRGLNDIEPNFNCNSQSAILLSATCGAGKTAVQHITIDYMARQKDAEGEKALILLASPRINLNQQLYEELIKIKDFKERFCVLNMSSGKFVDLNKFDISTSKGKGISNPLETKDKHIIVLACYRSLNQDFEKSARMIESRISNLTAYRTRQSKDVTFDLSIIDEAHKEIELSVVKNLRKISKMVIASTATPSNPIKEIFYSLKIYYGFRQARNDDVVARPSLFSVLGTNKIKEEYKAAAIMATIKHLLEDVNTGRLGDNKRPVLVVFDSTIDYLPNYSSNIRKKYPEEKFDIAILATDKVILIKNHLGEIVGKKEIYSSFNGIKMTDREVLDRVRKLKKPTVLLSAYKLQEGINVEEINGVCILCDKRENNLYQAICRGDRSAPGKEKFNVYVTEDNADTIDNFLRKMVFSFENEMYFDDGIELGTGAKPEVEEVDASGLPLVTPMAFRHRKAIVEHVSEYMDKNAVRLKLEDFMEEAQRMKESGEELCKVRLLFRRDEYITFSKEISHSLMDWLENELYR